MEPTLSEPSTPRVPAAQHTGGPLVSVVMPSYNTARYIQEAIESVLAQDYPHKELIIIDDGSTDGTPDLVRGYGDRVTLITQQNQGSAVARNAGLQAARGEYIAFLDSDDVWLPGKLSAQVQHLERHPEIGMVFARWQVWKPDGNGRFPPMQEAAPTTAPNPATPPGIVPDRSGWLYNRLLFSSLLHTITVMARRSLVDAVGPFDTELKRGQDYDYWLRASRLTEIQQLDRVLALYRLHGEGCVRRWPQVNYERVVVEKAVSRWGLEGPNGEHTPTRQIRRRLADTSFSFGYHHFWEGDPKLAFGAFAHAVSNQPTRPMAWAYLALSALKVPFPKRPDARRPSPSS